MTSVQVPRGGTWQHADASVAPCPRCSYAVVACAGSLGNSPAADPPTYRRVDDDVWPSACSDCPVARTLTVHDLTTLWSSRSLARRTSQEDSPRLAALTLANIASVAPNHLLLKGQEHALVLALSCAGENVPGQLARRLLGVLVA